MHAFTDRLCYIFVKNVSVNIRDVRICNGLMGAKVMKMKYTNVLVNILNYYIFLAVL